MKYGWMNVRNGLWSRMRHNMQAPGNRLLILFTVEGILITLVNNLVGGNNNLFAIRLGASDFELSLVITLPQLVGMLVLIPGGILTDHLANKRNMVTAALAALAAVYVLIGLVPALGAYKLAAFLILVAVSTAPMTIYNVSWQAYFSDVVNIDDRNGILTSRTGLAFLIGLIIPLTSGALLASTDTTHDKIMLHQVFYFVGVVLLLLQVFVLSRIKSNREQQHTGISIRNLKAVLLELVHNKSFLGFISVAMFFYVTWHIDWTLYFLGQVNYLGMNEAWLSYIGIGNSAVQFLTIGFWSRINRKKGVRYAIIFGNLGLALCPVSMIIATGVPVGYGKVIFLILNTLSNITLVTISLNIIQCLLQVIPEKNKTLNISIYTVLVTLSNAFMPLAGVAVYKKIGGDLRALQILFAIIFVLRIISSGLWALRYLILRKQPKEQQG